MNCFTHTEKHRKGAINMALGWKIYLGVYLWPMNYFWKLTNLPTILQSSAAQVCKLLYFQDLFVRHRFQMYYLLENYSHWAKRVYLLNIEGMMPSPPHILNINFNTETYFSRCLWFAEKHWDLFQYWAGSGQSHFCWIYISIKYKSFKSEVREGPGWRRLLKSHHIT